MDELIIFEKLQEATTNGVQILGSMVFRLNRITLSWISVLVKGHDNLKSHLAKMNIEDKYCR